MKSEDSVLAAIAGYVDTLSFVALFGLFTAHVTGNFVLIGAGAAGFGQGVLDTIDILSPQIPSDARAAARTRLGKMLPTIIAFAAGAILGALAYRHTGFWALLLPCVVLLWLALKARGAQTQLAASGTVTDARR